MATEADFRLPRTVVPSHYDLRLVPDLESATFRGDVGVDVDVTETVGEVVLNAIEIDIVSASLVAADGTRMTATPSYDPETQRAILSLEGEATPGRWRLHAAFTGTLNDQLHGFYRSTFKAEDGTARTIATTQFEATEARRAFPCWDEPDLKATFTVTLVVDDGLLAVSNAAEVSREPAGDGKVAVTFAETMEMSTYLVAFVIGDLVATDPVDIDGVPLRIVHRRGQEELTGFALEMGAHALRFFAEYYGIPYPGDKLDMIAIPDFAWGAMENLGAITYRDTALLIDREKASQAELVRVADVIAHEIAHMWFGDLVTMKWWNGIWLNEAFATFAELKCVDAYRPDWKRWLSFSASRSHSMHTDALVATRPIEFAVASPDEANQMFDTLTYQKGSAVLRMLEQFLGEDAFRAGVARYLRDHAYGNTETADLWAALEAESGQPVGDIMDGWIFTGGFPQVSVAGGDGGYTVRQDQFRYREPGSSLWKVPMLLRTEEGMRRLILEEREATVEAGPGLVVNAGGDGFYRVRYSPELLADLRSRLGDLDATERYNLVSDTWASVLTGDTAAADFVGLVGAMGDEAEPDVWGAMLGGLGELDRVVSSDARPAMQRFVRDLVGDAADSLGWAPQAGESDRTRELRGLLIKGRGVLGDDTDTKRVAEDVWRRHREGEVFDAEVRDAALAVVAANGTLDHFKVFLDQSDGAANPQDVVKYLRAATAVPEAEAAEKLFQMVLDGDVRSQDSMWVLALLLGHRENGPRVWELIKANWEATLAAMPPQNKQRMLDLLHFRSEPSVAADIEAFLTGHRIPSGEKFTEQQIELMKVRVGLREREADRIGSALD